MLSGLSRWKYSAFMVPKKLSIAALSKQLPLAHALLESASHEHRSVWLRQPWWECTIRPATQLVRDSAAFLNMRPPRAVGRSLPAGLSPHRQRLCSTVRQTVVLASSWAVLHSRSRAPAGGLDRDCITRPRFGWDCGCHRSPRLGGWRAAHDPDGTVAAV